MPLFAVVRAKRPRLIVAPMSALQGLGNITIVTDSNAPKCYFFLELLPLRSELSPVHRRLLPRYFQARPFTGNAREAGGVSAEESPRPLMIWPRAKNLEPPPMRGEAGTSPSPQVLASGPLIENGGFVSRSLDSPCIGCSGPPRQPSESTHAEAGGVSPPNENGPPQKEAPRAGREPRSRGVMARGLRAKGTRHHSPTR
jgi:hypothetical protein